MFVLLLTKVLFVWGIASDFDADLRQGPAVAEVDGPVRALQSNDVTASRGSTAFISIYRRLEGMNFGPPSVFTTVSDVTSDEDCALLCLDKLGMGCTGFTWLSQSENRGSICYLRSGYLAQSYVVPFESSRLMGASGFIQPISFVNSFLSYRSFPGRDYYGSDDHHIDGVNSAEECARRLEGAAQGITGFTWLDSTTSYPNRCHLKRGALILTHLSDFEGAVSGFLDNMGILSDFQYFDNKTYPQGNVLTAEELGVEDPSACANTCMRRYQRGCRGFNWNASSNSCSFLGGALTGRSLEDSEGSVFGMLQPLCSESHRTYTSTSIADERVPVATVNISAEANCRALFASRTLFENRSHFSFYAFTRGRTGAGVCRIYDGTFDSSLLFLDDSSSTSVPCEERPCVNGFRVYADRGSNLIPNGNHIGNSEAFCRGTRFGDGSDYRYYYFKPTGNGVGRCFTYQPRFSESNLFHERGSSVVVRC